MNATEWTRLGSDDQGDPGLPACQYSIIACTIYRRGKRYRAVCADEWGENQGSSRWTRGESQREYRANSLDDLLRIAISGERDSLNADDAAGMASAIRNAAAQAEDAEVEAANTTAGLVSALQAE